MKILAYLAILLVLVFPVFANEISDVLGEGETKHYTLGGKDYEVTVMIIEDVTPSKTTLEINGEITASLKSGENYKLNDGIIVQIDKIELNEAGEPGTGDLVFISFSNYCGDSTCNNVETCNSCSIDCGCELGDFCGNDVCRKIECGDGYCSGTETCEEDNCCYGREKDFEVDTYNCGVCGNSCGYKNKCVDGVCESEIEEVVEEVEEPEIVEEVIEVVIIEDKCDSKEDCDDGNPCSLDICSGKPKECSNELGDGCIQEDSCLSQGTVVGVSDVYLYCNLDNSWKKQKEDGIECNENYECLNNDCVEGICFVEKEVSFIGNFFSWFGKLFSS